MSQCLQAEIDPLKITDEYLQGVLVAIDVLAYSPEEYPREPDFPVALIAAVHTSGLSSISKAYAKIFVAGAASEPEEGQVIRAFAAYLDMFDGGTIAAHYGACEGLDDGFDLPYLQLRARDHHPGAYPALRHALLRFRKHDTCRFARDSLSLPSFDLDYLESYYGLQRCADARVDDAKAGLAAYWRDGDNSVIKGGLANAYNCLRIAQSQIRKSICCTDIPL